MCQKVVISISVETREYRGCNAENHISIAALVAGILRFEVLGGCHGNTRIVAIHRKIASTRILLHFVW